MRVHMLMVAGEMLLAMLVMMVMVVMVVLLLMLHAAVVLLHVVERRCLRIERLVVVTAWRRCARMRRGWRIGDEIVQRLNDAAIVADGILTGDVLEQLALVVGLTVVKAVDGVLVGLLVQLLVLLLLLWLLLQRIVHTLIPRMRQHMTGGCRCDRMTGLGGRRFGRNVDDRRQRIGTRQQMHGRNGSRRC